MNSLIGNISIKRKKKRRERTNVSIDSVWILKISAFAQVVFVAWCFLWHCAVLWHTNNRNNLETKWLISIQCLVTFVEHLRQMLSACVKVTPTGSITEILFYLALLAQCEETVDQWSSCSFRFCRALASMMFHIPGIHLLFEPLLLQVHFAWHKLTK